jgi:hypothetical protein
MEINQDSFTQVAFAESLHRGIKRLFKAARAEKLLTEKLEAAAKEKEEASDFIREKLVPLSDEELSILGKNFPDVERFVNTLIESRKETVSENTEGAK